VSSARVVLIAGQTAGEWDHVTLAEGLRRHDGRAELAAWQRYETLVSRTVRRLAGPRCDEEDLSQEVFLRFFRSIGALRDPSAMRSFVIGICIRVVRHDMRTRWLRRWLNLTDKGSVPEVVAPTADTEAREVVARFYRVLDRLSSESRSLFVARHLEGLGLAEVAELHAMSLSTAQRKLGRVQARVALLTAGDPAIAAYLERGAVR
jgi:RNA polymerase sigma-70 factor (ECF subfamily)